MLESVRYAITRRRFQRQVFLPTPFFIFSRVQNQNGVLVCEASPKRLEVFWIAARVAKVIDARETVVRRNTGAQQFAAASPAERADKGSFQDRRSIAPQFTESHVGVPHVQPAFLFGGELHQRLPDGGKLV